MPSGRARTLHGMRHLAQACLWLTWPMAALAQPSTASEAVPAAEAAPAARNFEGAGGLVMSYKPAFSGSSDRQWKPELAGFLRWGRWTLSGPGGFTTRAQDEVERGLDTLLLRREGLRVNLALRYDPGRQESDSADLAGMGDVPATVRARLGLRWEPAPLWSVNMAANFDAFGRGGGTLVQAGVQRRIDLGERRRLVLGAALQGGGDRYMQTWYGVTPTQSASSGYLPYRAPGGLRDVALSAVWRAEFDDHWAGFTSLGVSRLLGPAADSPLVLQRNAASLSVGLARRF